MSPTTAPTETPPADWATPGLLTFNYFLDAARYCREAGLALHNICRLDSRTYGVQVWERDRTVGRLG